MRSPRRVGVVEGALVVVSLPCVPLALVAALHAPVVARVVPVVDAFVAAGVVAWVVLVVGLARLVADELRGRSRAAEAGPLGWMAVRVAALVLVLAPFLDTAHGGSIAIGSTSTARRTAAAVATSAPRARAIAASSTRASPRRAPRCPNRTPSVPLGSGPLLVPLAAIVRRRYRLDRRLRLSDDAAVDVESALLGSAPEVPLLAAVAGTLHAAGRLGDAVHVVVVGGEARADDGSWTFDPASPRSDVRCLALVLGGLDDEVHVVLVPRGAVLRLAGHRAATQVDDAVRVAPALGLGRPVVASVHGLLRALAVRDDDELVVCTSSPGDVDAELRRHCVVAELDSEDPLATVLDDELVLADGRSLVRSALAPSVRALLDGTFDRPFEQAVDGSALGPLEDHGVVVRLLAAVPRVDGLVSPIASARERRAVELVAYLSLRDGEPVTGERLRMRVLGTDSTDAAAQTLFNVASCLRRSLGDGPFGPRLPPAGRLSHYSVAADVLCDVAVLEARAARSRLCEDVEERMAWLRAALELVESEPFATVLDGYDWFLSEGHLTRLQAVCEDAACELVELALAHGLVELAAFAVDRARLIDPHGERLAAAAARVAASRQASFDAIAPAVRSTVPSAPSVT